MRQSGILMHISSLPGPGGIGSLGQEAYDFADFLHASGMKLWQVLPMGPTGYGESPYQSSSVFAGNPMLISCARLKEEGLLEYAPEEEFSPTQLDKIDFPAVRENKEMLLRRCFDKSERKLEKVAEKPISDEQLHEEQIAAIAAALKLYKSALHDRESEVLTIMSAKRAYSPWNSKIHGLTQLPDRK